MYDYSYINQRCKMLGFIWKDIAFKIGVTPTTLSNKLNNKNEFKQTEMLEICKILHINDLSRAFFTKKEENNNDMVSI